MLKIKILGSGCANCKRLEQMAREAVAELGLQAEFIKVTDYNEITAYDILSTPGLVIDDRVVSSGRLPSQDELRTWLAQAAAGA